MRSALISFLLACLLLSSIALVKNRIDCAEWRAFDGNVQALRMPGRGNPYWKRMAERNEATRPAFCESVFADIYQPTE